MDTKMCKLILSLFLLLFVLTSCSLPFKQLHNEAQLFKQKNINSFKQLSFKNKNIHYLQYGNKNGLAVMFIHGSPGSWQGWVRYANNSFLQQNYNLILVDRLGYGLSSSEQSEVSIEEQARSLLMVIHSEKIKSVVLVGHSLGGAIIAKMAMLEPELIQGLIFVAASVDPSLEETKWFQIPAQWPLLKYAIPNDLRICNEEILSLKTQLESMKPSWGKIKSSVFIIHGEKDDLVPVENVDFMLKALDSKLTIYKSIEKNLDHFIPWTQPELINKAILTLTGNQ